MEMHHCLACVSAGVHNDAKTSFINAFAASNLTNKLRHCGKSLSIYIVQNVVMMCFWNNQNMHWSLRIGIPKGRSKIIFTDHIGRNFS